MTYTVTTTMDPDGPAFVVSDREYENLLDQGIINTATPGGVDSDPEDPAYLVGDTNVVFQHAVEVGETLDVGTNLTVAQRLTIAGFDLPSVRKTGRPVTRSVPTQGFYMASGHGWVSGGTGTASSNLNDTTNFLLGDQSVRATTTGAGNQSYVRKTSLSAIDLTGKAIRVTFKVADVTNLDRIALYISSESGFTNFMQFDFYSDNGQPNSYVQSGEWCTWEIPWSAVSNRGGTYTLTNGVPTTEAMRTGFTAISFAVYDDAAGAVTYYLDAVEIVPDTSTIFPNGVISFTADDSWLTQFTIMRKVLDKYGFRATAYNICDLVGNNASYMTLDQLKRLKFDSGWELGAHAYYNANHGLANGFSSTTAANVDRDFFMQKAFSDKYGFEFESLAYPKGHFENTTDAVPVKSIAERYFNTSRTIAGGSYETWPPAQPQKLRAITGVNDGVALGGRTVTSLTGAGGDYDRIAGSGAWQIATFHKFSAGTPADSAECSEAGLIALCDAIVSRGIAVLPVQEVIRYYR